MNTIFICSVTALNRSLTGSLTATNGWVGLCRGSFGGPTWVAFA